MESENAYAASRSPEPKPPAEPKKLWVSISRAVIVFVIFFGLVAMLIPAVNQPYPAALRTQCLNNCRQIALAMHNYESGNGHFPPAYIADENGKPMHSWRVLLLPFLEQQELYDRYDMSEPWNGPNNSKLHNEIVDVYRCPSSSSNECCTDYVLITGEGTGFVKDQTIRFDDITDGSSNTISLTELAGSKTHWMQPRDISMDQFLAIKRSDRNTTNHPGTSSVAHFDASTHYLSNEIDLLELRKRLTIAGGEIIDASSF